MTAECDVNDARVLTDRLRALRDAKLNGICEYAGGLQCRDDVQNDKAALQIILQIGLATIRFVIPGCD